MTWYFWVWGVASSIGALAIVVLTAAIIGETILKRREEEHGMRGELRAAERTIAAMRRTIERQKAELDEIKKGRNEYGQIIP